MLLEIINSWASGLWPAMQNDVTFALICGVILIAAQFVNAFFGINKSKRKGEPFNAKVFLLSVLDEIWITLATIGAVALLYMLAGLAGLTLLPGFEIGDLPTLAILLSFGTLVVKKVLNIADNLMETLKGDIPIKIEEDVELNEEED